MARKGNPISVRRDLNRSSDSDIVGRKKISFFLESLLKRTKDSVSSFFRKNENLFFFFVKLFYLTCFFLVFLLSYSHIFPTIEGENYTRPFQVILQLSLYLLHFRSFTTKEEKEAKWLLIMSAFYSVLATLFLKNLVSLEGLLFIIVPLFFFLYFVSSIGRRSSFCHPYLLFIGKGTGAMDVFSSISANSVLRPVLLFGSSPQKVNFSPYSTYVLFLCFRSS